MTDRRAEKYLIITGLVSLALVCLSVGPGHPMNIIEAVGLLTLAGWTAVAL